MLKLLRSPLFFFKLIFFTSILLFLNYIPLFPDNLFGLKFTSLSWMLMFIICIPFLISVSRPTFPALLYIPYFIYIFIRTLVSPSLDAYQFFIQPLIPIFIAIITSSFTYNEFIFIKLFKFLKYYASAIILITILTIFNEQDVPNRASVVMTICIFGSISLSIYFIKKKSSGLWYYILFVLYNVFAVMRMATLMILVIFPLHFANTKIRTRILSIFLGIIGGTLIFLSPSFQRKMFYTGQGNISDLSWENPNFNSSGRNTLKSYVETDLKEYPVFGKGPRKDIELYAYNNVGRAILHNDYLLLRHSYGYFGLILFLSTISLQFFFLFKKKNKMKGSSQLIIWASTLTLFIPYLGFMYTDNIYLYGPFYGHFMFALIGILYALDNTNKQSIQRMNNPVPIYNFDSFK